MLNLHHVTKSYRGKRVIDGVDLAIVPGEVVALIGENGAGKTTLLNIMRGAVQPDEGSITNNREVVGYVPQDIPLGDKIGGCFVVGTEPWRIDYALSLVGLTDRPHDTFVHELSGGQRTRLAFATVLAADPEPTILLLDEPTNNLDVEGLQWLCGFVKSFRGSVVLVSHDRAFINAVATSVLELENGKLRLYGGDYDFYRSQKEVEHQSELLRYEESMAERGRLLKVLRTQQQKGQHTQNHIKRSDNDKSQRDFFRNRVSSKFGQQAKLVETRIAKLDVQPQPQATKRYSFSLGDTGGSARLVLRLCDVAKGFEAPVLNGVNLIVRGGDRIHLQGVNGSGKTSLLKIAAGVMDADSGVVQVGDGVRIGYFSQDTDGLDYSRSNLANLSVADANTTQIYQQARAMDMTEADLRKTPAELSRGQQAKLAFAKLLLSKYQLLILDEPTNHLDIPTRERLEAALCSYDGAILFASHDRYFVDQIAANRQVQIVRGELYQGLL